MRPVTNTINTDDEKVKKEITKIIFCLGLCLMANPCLAYVNLQARVASKKSK